MMEFVKLLINEKIYRIDSKYENETVLFVLREVLGLTGTKKACGTNDCGACKILLDGQPVNSCVLKVKKVLGKSITTIEGLEQDGQLHPVQEAFIEAGAVQCGFCTPGMVLTAKALLDQNPDPGEKEIREAIQGNLCRCTGYVKIIDAIQLAAEKLLKEVDHTHD